MIIKSLKAEIAVLALVSIFTISVLVLWFSVNAYESLYKQAASDDLNGLSQNLSIELINNVVEQEQDPFAITNTLLKLDQYENVRFAAVFNEDRVLIEPYYGKVTMRALGSIERGEKGNKLSASDLSVNFEDYLKYPVGMTETNGLILAKKRIGDAQSPVGYLLIANDLSLPLNNSKKDLLLSVLPWVMLTLFMSIAIIFSFQNRALRPLIQLANFTRRIRDTKEYSLVAAVSGKREIAVLTEGLNAMLQEINSEVEKNLQKNQLLIEQQEQMEKLANYDVLTGLPNRQFFMQKLSVALQIAQQKGSDLVLLFFDLDGFKTVNDSFGHEIGDKLLCVVAERIKTILGHNHQVARLGGDEFLVLIEGEARDEYVLDIADQFIARVSQPVDIDYWNLQVGTSVGIAKASDSDFKLTELVGNADIAMYRAKAEGRNQYKLFSLDMIQSSRRKLNIANAIHTALANNEFKLFYQPKVDAKGNTIGYEALARWFSDELGHISPAEFIPIAEQSGKITQITEWVIEQVCKDSKAILALRDCVKIALNLSVHDIKNPRLMSLIAQQMKTYRVKPKHIEFEITESAYLDNFDNANTFIAQIKRMGSTIALDDFGTGYSSLSYLTQIDIDVLKIDKQFVDHIGISSQSTLITKTIIEMAKQLNLEVCAEGVETLEQSKLLIENGCQLMQGYYFGKPLALQSALARLKTEVATLADPDI